MVVIGALALLGEVSVRLLSLSVYSPRHVFFVCSYLNAMLKAVQLYHTHVSTFSR